MAGFRRNHRLECIGTTGWFASDYADRAGPYADAARTGAPGAIQVADRWHLLVNASDALRHVVERHQPQLRDAVRLCAAPAVSPPSRRHARFEAVQRLHAEGVPIKQIVRRTGVARNAVRRWLRAGEFIPYRRAPASSLLNRHQPFLEKRWLAGERRSTDLHRALQARGFERLRHRPPLGRTAASERCCAGPAQPHPLGAQDHTAADG